ncbi:uncharacterized protein LOC9651702 [Selaginella moellendorffii]|uniref:uncharacterized protein LOC9651702 n=1 Tax=Selaginella moellendorffii TaxID=88036 RepID=UPI000D1CC276|nr:uncharacterized protein LOC9651702 [Selaginella moellendorffii]|eukprot:XP_024533174.1 uncharacterized protein LOC9651702 [Selaginella moellendorffii]
MRRAMPQMGEMTMARSDRAAQHSAEQKSSSIKNHAAAAAAAGALSPPMMSKAQVVYYLCRGGKIEPPHMIEVPHSHDGLRLRDVKHRLTILRGGGMPNMFSWSCKRMYKSTYIWQDVCDDDSLTPASGGEYVLKGSEYFMESNNNQEKPLKFGTGQEVLQRKFRGAETWLKASSGSLSPKEYAAAGSIPEKMPENCSSVSVQAVTSQLGSLGLDHHNGKRHAPEASSGSDECSSTKRANGGGGFSHEDSGMHDIKVCEVSRPHTGAPSIDHACTVATQTEENGYVYCPPDYKSSGSSTPTCFGNERRHPEQLVPSVAPVGKGPSKHEGGKLKRRFGRQQAEGKGASPKVKMKHSAASCVFLHILSYCGGVDTKMQSRAPTEITSSEYSFDGGICRAENKMVMTSQNRSPQQYSMELHGGHHHHHHQLPYQGMDNNRSGPLIPYSSEYFDVKETVSPLQSSPLQAKSSKAASSNSDEDVVVLQEEATDEECGGEGDPKADVEKEPCARRRRPRAAAGSAAGGNLLRSGGGGAPPEVEKEWLWSRCSSAGYDRGAPQVTAAAAANLRPWNRNLRLSKRRFFRHWWQAMFESVQAKAVLTRTRTWPRDKQRKQQQQQQQRRQISGTSKHFWAGKWRRSRTRALGC